MPRGEKEWSTTHRNVHKFNPERMPDQIICKNRSALQTRIRPSLGIRMRDVQAGYRHGEYLVGRLRDSSPHRFFVDIVEDGGHGSEYDADICLEVLLGYVSRPARERLDHRSRRS